MDTFLALFAFNHPGGQNSFWNSNLVWYLLGDYLIMFVHQRFDLNYVSQLEMWHLIFQILGP